MKPNSQTLNPARWDPVERDDYVGRPYLVESGPAFDRSDRAMLVGSTGPFAQLAGRRALEVGGTAADAVLTTALAQIVLAAGSWVSFAGIFSLVYYEAAADKVHSLHAGYKTFQEETTPLTIPNQGTPSGRTAMVPGFFAGVEAAHRSFGKLPWKEIFGPAIYAADRGRLVDSRQEATFKVRRDVLGRTPEGRAIFFGKDGELSAAGDQFRQPELAQTLDIVAREGIEHIYRGDWAKRFVELVRRDGGAATLEDLASYQPQWSDPFRGDFNGYELCTIGPPAAGGVWQIEGLHLAEEAKLGDPLSSGEALYWLVQIWRQVQLSDDPNHERITRSHARNLWQRMSENGGMVAARPARQGTHSDYVLAVDSEGNVAAVCHTINAVLWGTTGIFVNGISIPDSASFQQAAVAAVGRGGYLYTSLNPLIVLRNSRPFLASSSIGGGMTEVTLQCLLALLGRGIELQSVVSMPLVHALEINADPHLAYYARFTNLVETGLAPAEAWATIIHESAQVIEEGFDPIAIKDAVSRGLKIDVRAGMDPLIPRGYWAGIRIDPQQGQLQGGRTRAFNGEIEKLS